ncbi:hypothetical protein [Amniculibacterium aquaticum]|uniref:hypothetical protein n=1 Tax=Amniculibacterium aquaticum TaxID=2479858 RepID=UPI001F15099C|nr:hypothetical protein [Amniculibacterium aquaticum]
MEIISSVLVFGRNIVVIGLNRTSRDEILPIYSSGYLVLKILCGRLNVFLP